MLKILTKIKYRITNPKIVHEAHSLKSDNCLSFYHFIGYKQTKLAAMTFNKPDNNNNITQQCSDQLFRFLTSYHHDHTVENVWIENKGPAFTGGADLSQLKNNPLYLDKLMRLSIMIAQFNKPIFAKVNGTVRGIGAYLITMFSTPIGTDKSSMKLDQTSKGFIPIFGGSHKLSRLPCNLGIYIALSGDRLNKSEMAQLGYLRANMRGQQYPSKQIRKHLSNANLFMKYPYTPSSHGLSQIKKQNLILFKMNYFQDLISETQFQLFQQQLNTTENLALNQYRIAQTQYYNTLNPYHNFYPNQPKLNNYFQMRHDRPFNYLKQKGILQQSLSQNTLLTKVPLQKLIKIFSHSTIKDVINQLKQDPSSWAKTTLDIFYQKDPLALHLTFHLIKQAQTLSWVQTLQLQYKLARRILDISNIQYVNTAGGGTIHKLTNKYSHLKPQQIPQQTIQHFLKPPQKQSQKFYHNTPKHSLLPTSQYWRKIPDAGRNYLNRTFFQDIHSKFAEVQIRRFLNSQRIDYRDKSFNLPKLRQYLYKNMDYQILLDLQAQRINATLKSQVTLSSIKTERLKYAKQKIQSKQFPKIIKSQIAKYYQNKFTHRFDDLKKTFKIAGKQQRMNILRKYVDILINNIVYKGHYIQQNVRANNVRHIGIVRFDEKGSDVFHAQSNYQKQCNQLNILKQAYKTNDRKKLQLIGDIQKKADMFSEHELLHIEKEMIKKDEELKKNYGKSMIPQQQAEIYRYLIQKASKTSQQIAQFLNWTNKDIIQILQKTPKQKPLFKQFASNVMQRTQQIQQKISKLNQLYTLFKKTKTTLLQTNTDSQQHQQLAHGFFNTQLIPRPFKRVHFELLNQVLSFFTKKYELNGKLTSFAHQQHPTIPLIHQWGRQALNSQMKKLLKNDVQYIFSYLVIMHLKFILSQISQQMIPHHKIIKFLSGKFKIHFQGFTYNQFNQMFMKYLYSILDLHQSSKHRIIFPQNKIIEFINTLKMQNQFRLDDCLSFQSFMLLVAKDRKIIKDFQYGTIPLLGYDPEFNLNILSTQRKKYKGNKPIFFQGDDERLLSSQEAQENPIQAMTKLNANQAKIQEKSQQKRLVLGFIHYLTQFQGMLQKIASDTLFLPKQLYQNKNKQIYQSLKNLLRIQLTNQQWFSSKIKSAVAHLLDFRLQLQKKMTLGQLQIFDIQYSEFFTPQMITLVLTYQTSTQQHLSRQLLQSHQSKKQRSLPKQQDNYIDIKRHIKNPTALKMLNNLVYTHQIVQDRIKQLKQSQEKLTHQMPTQQQAFDLAQQNKNINKRTLQRLSYQSFIYPKEDNLYNISNVTSAKNALVFGTVQKQTTFIQELQLIQKNLEKSDLQAELADRIVKIKQSWNQ